MLTRLHSRLLVALVLLSVLVFTSCGDDKSVSSANTVAVVGDAVITKANLNHWMKTIVGGDFFERIKRRAPLGLVAEPQDYAACVSASETLVAESKQGTPFTQADLRTKCTQLYQGVKQQAVIFLISAQWRINEGAENGMRLSDAEVSRYAREANTRDFPKSGELAKYLADRRWVPSDQLYQFKRNLLTTKLKDKIDAQDNAKAQSSFIDFIKNNVKKRTAETNCRPGYITFQCRQFKAPGEQPLAPLIVLEELVLGKHLPH